MSQRERATHALDRHSPRLPESDDETARGRCGHVVCGVSKSRSARLCVHGDGPASMGHPVTSRPPPSPSRRREKALAKWWGVLFTWPRGPFCSCRYHSHKNWLNPGGQITPLSGVVLRRRVASSLPAYTRSRARGVLVFCGVGPPPSPRVPRSRAGSYTCGPCVSCGAQAGGVRPLPAPATRRCRGAVRLYAVPRRTRRRGDAVRGAAGPAVWGRWRAGTACACCARYSTSWSPASSSSCSLIML